MTNHWFAETMCCDDMTWLLQHRHPVVVISFVALDNKYYLTLNERTISFCPFCGTNIVIRDETD